MKFKATIFKIARLFDRYPQVVITAFFMNFTFFLIGINEYFNDSHIKKPFLVHMVSPQDLTEWGDRGIAVLVISLYGFVINAFNQRLRKKTAIIISSQEAMLEAAEEKEIRTEELYILATAVKNAIEGIMILEEKGRVVYCNESLCKIFSLTREEILGDLPRFIFNEDENRWFTDSEIRQKLIVSSENFFTIEAKDSFGKLIILQLGRSLVKDEEIVGNYIFFVKDITQELLKEQKHRMSQKMEAIGTLAGGIAHDFNNILNVIGNSATLATMSVTDGDEDTLTNLERIKRGCDRATELTRKILTFSAKEQGEKNQILVTPLVKETVSLVQVSKPRNVEVVESYNCGNSCAVIAIPTDVQQIVMNLLTNSFYAMKEKGGTINIGLNCFKADKYYSADHQIEEGDYVKLDISDEGGGIPPEIIEKIFDPFFTTKPKDEGTGMGLSMIHGIVKNCKGTIIINNNYGIGVGFSIILPRYNPLKDNIQKIVTQQNKKRIMYVDDEKCLVETYGELLTVMGHDPEIYNNPLEALQAFSENPYNYDMVITDICMPELNGRELIEKLLVIRKDIHILVFTGYKHDDELKIRTLGVKHILEKPVTVEELSVLLNQIFNSEK